MSFSTARIFKIFLTLIFSIPLAIWIAALFTPSLTDTYTTFSTFALPLFGITCLLYNLLLGLLDHKWHAGTNFFALALVSYGVGELLWYSSTTYLHLNLPYPSISDLWYSLYYPLLIAGLIIISLKVQNKYGSFDKWAAFLGISIIFIAYAFFTTQSSLVFGSNPDTVKSFFDISYIVWDALLLVSIIALAGNIINYSKQDAYPMKAVVITAVSLILMLLGDTLFSYTTDLGTYTQGNFIDLLFFISTYLLAYSTLRFHDSASTN